MSGRTDVNGFATWRNCDALPPGIAWEAPLHPASGWAMRAATARPVAVRRIELLCNICNSCRSVVDPDTRRVTRIVRQGDETQHPQLLQLTGTVAASSTACALAQVHFYAVRLGTRASQYSRPSIAMRCR